MRPQRNRDDKMRLNLNTKAREGARGPFVGDLCYVVIFIKVEKDSMCNS